METEVEDEKGNNVMSMKVTKCNKHGEAWCVEKTEVESQSPRGKVKSKTQTQSISVNEDVSGDFVK